MAFEELGRRPAEIRRKELTSHPEENLRAEEVNAGVSPARSVVYGNAQILGPAHGAVFIAAENCNDFPFPFRNRVGQCEQPMSQDIA